MDRSILIAWLNDAYVMETQLLPILIDYANDIRDDPTAWDRLFAHVGETEYHAKRVRDAIAHLGGTVSELTSGVPSVIAEAQGASTGLFSDELVKNVLADYVAEQFEVAAYTALIAAAEAISEPEVARLCRLNLEEDSAMAEWLEAQIPLTVGRKISLTEADATRAAVARR